MTNHRSCDNPDTVTSALAAPMLSSWVIAVSGVGPALISTMAPMIAVHEKGGTKTFPPEGG